MGYYTNYSLEVDGGNGLDIIADLKAVCDNASYALCDDGSTSDQLKWYDHESDMIAFSRKYPDVLFTLYGAGEESGDIWRQYFLNGKSQIAKAIITYDPFDETKLR